MVRMKVSQLEEIKKYHFEVIGYAMVRVFHNNYENWDRFILACYKIKWMTANFGLLIKRNMRVTVYTHNVMTL